MPRTQARGRNRLFSLPFLAGEEEDTDVLSFVREMNQQGKQSRNREIKQNKINAKLIEEEGEVQTPDVVDGQAVQYDEPRVGRSGFGGRTERRPRADALDRAIDTASPGIQALRQRRDARRSAREQFYGANPTASERRAARMRGETPRVDPSTIDSINGGTSGTPPALETPPAKGYRKGQDVLSFEQAYPDAFDSPVIGARFKTYKENEGKFEPEAWFKKYWEPGRHTIAGIGPQGLPPAKPGDAGVSHIGNTPLTKWKDKPVGTQVAADLAEWEKASGLPVSLTDGYRTHEQQAEAFKNKPGLAVAPGKSFHEQGNAIDVDPASFGGYDTPEYARFVDHMKSKGYAWGGEFKNKKEPWHFGLGEGKAQAPGTPAPGGSITPTEVEYARAAKQKGFTGDALVKALQVALGENSGNLDPNAVGDESLANAKWGPSIGGWQSRTLNAQRGAGGARDHDALMGNIDAQAQSAWDISGGGKNWQPWTAHTSGDDQKYASEASELARLVSSGADQEDVDRYLAGVKRLPQSKGSAKPAFDPLSAQWRKDALVEALKSGAVSEQQATAMLPPGQEWLLQSWMADANKPVPEKEWLGSQPDAVGEAWNYWNKEREEGDSLGAAMKAITGAMGPEAASAVRERAHQQFPTTNQPQLPDVVRRAIATQQGGGKQPVPTLDNEKEQVEEALDKYLGWENYTGEDKDSEAEVLAEIYRTYGPEALKVIRSIRGR